MIHRSAKQLKAQWQQHFSLARLAEHDEPLFNALQINATRQQTTLQKRSLKLEFC